MTKNRPILIRVPESFKQELERQAEKESRSLSQYIFLLLKRSLAETAFKGRRAS